MSHEIIPEIGSVIRRIRTERDLTLEEASALTGVSKTMLGQIERNESSPTISLLWKVASGLRISFSDLLANDTAELEMQPIESKEAVYESQNKMILYTVFPFTPASGFEYFYIRLLPGAHHISGTHINAVEEYIVVTQGKMDITVNNKVYSLVAPCSFQFQPKMQHVYANPYEEEAIFQNIVKY